MFRLVHLVSVGTSLVRNGLGVLGGSEEFGDVVRAVEPCLRARPGSREDVACLEMADGWGRVHEAFLGFVWDSPWRASAELNAMRPWLEAGGDFVWEVVLYPTLTGAGMLAARVLKRALEKFGIERVEVRPIEGFRLGVWAGVVGLLSRLNFDIDRYRRVEDATLMFNATGGFKPEAAFMVLAGVIRSAGRAFAYYIHEYHREPTVMPLVFGRQLERAMRLILEAKSRRDKRKPWGRWITIEKRRLEQEDEWLLRFAHLLEPLEHGRVTEDAILLSPEIAEMIEALQS